MLVRLVGISIVNYDMDRCCWIEMLNYFDSFRIWRLLESASLVQLSADNWALKCESFELLCLYIDGANNIKSRLWCNYAIVMLVIQIHCVSVSEKCICVCGDGWWVETKTLAINFYYHSCKMYQKMEIHIHLVNLNWDHTTRVPKHVLD